MWTPIGGQTRVECSALQFITRSPQSPVATIFISSRSTIRKLDARTVPPAYCHKPFCACPGGTVLRGLFLWWEFASHGRGRIRGGAGRTDQRTNVGMPTYTHCKPCRASPRYRGQTRTNGLLEKLIGRLDAGQILMAGVSFSSQI